MACRPPDPIVKRRQAVFGACTAARVAEFAALGDQRLVNRRDSRILLQPPVRLNIALAPAHEWKTRARRDLQISRKAGWREVQLIISVPRIHGCKHPQRELNKQNSVAFTLACGSYGFVVNEDNGVICRRRGTRHYPGHDRFSSRPLLHSRAYLLNRINFWRQMTISLHATDWSPSQRYSKSGHDTSYGAVKIPIEPIRVFAGI